MQKVQLIRCDGAVFIDSALGKCWDKGNYTGTKQVQRIKRNALKLKHESVLEFCNFIFDVKASTKTLLELSRHRIGISLACKSTRYTLKKDLRNEKSFVKADEESDRDFFNRVGKYVVLTDDKDVNRVLINTLESVRVLSNTEISNDKLSLLLPQSFIYNFQVQFNARSLRHFLELRLNKSAHYQIREVAEMMLKEIPESLKFLFEFEE